jgi:predicted RNase H-like HicB family nuclease
MVIQWSDVDQVFVVTLPEFNGCKTHGATYEEAGRMGREVLELLIETYEADGTPLPEPLKYGATPMHARGNLP